MLRPRAQLSDGLSYIHGGHGRFTLVGRERRFTYRLSRSDDDKLTFVKVLSGPDNNNDYQYIGFIPEGEDKLVAGRKGHPDALSFKALDWYLHHPDHPAVEFWHEGACCKCGRALTNPESIARGIGPHCAGEL
jgi:hypothetical protein